MVEQVILHLEVQVEEVVEEQVLLIVLQTIMDKVEETPLNGVETL